VDACKTHIRDIRNSGERRIIAVREHHIGVLFMYAKQEFTGTRERHGYPELAVDILALRREV